MNNVIVKGDVNEVIDVDSLVSAFLSGRKTSTIQAYRQDLQELCRFLEVAEISEAVAILLQRSHGSANALALKYKAHLTDHLKFQAATVNRRLAALRSLVKLARTMGLIQWTLEVENRKTTPYRDVSGVGIEGIQAMLSLLESRTDLKSVRDYAILRLLFDLGLRREEICTIELSDLNLERGTVSILGKGRCDKEALKMPDATDSSIRNWLSSRGTTEGPLFSRLDKAAKSRTKRLTGTGLYSIIKDVGRRAGIKKMTVHKVRHSAITTCCQVIAENGLGIETLVKFSRHKNLNTALVYMDHLKGQQGQLADLVSKKVGTK